MPAAAQPANPPAVHSPAPAPQKSRAAANYHENSARPANERPAREPRPYAVGNVLQRYAKNPPTPKKRHTNRLHARKQAKQRAKRKKA